MTFVFTLQWRKRKSACKYINILVICIVYKCLLRIQYIIILPCLSHLCLFTFLLRPSENFTVLWYIIQSIITHTSAYLMYWQYKICIFNIQDLANSMECPFRKLIVVQLVKFPNSYGTQRLITVFTKNLLCWSISWVC